MFVFGLCTIAKCVLVVCVCVCVWGVMAMPRLQCVGRSGAESPLPILTCIGGCHVLKVIALGFGVAKANSAASVHVYTVIMHMNVRT